tara:strand:+ start:2662 stop:2781 length:120 start_codon:yes stop_codon:yes gene_type:complete
VQAIFVPAIQRFDFLIAALLSRLELYCGRHTPISPDQPD